MSGAAFPIGLEKRSLSHDDQMAGRFNRGIKSLLETEKKDKRLSDGGREVDEEVPSDGMDGRNLSSFQWIRYGPFLAQIVVVRRCNLSCAYCSEFDKTSEPIASDVLSSRFRKLRQLKTWAVCLTGGEPTLHPNLPGLIGELKALGVRRRLMITNGYRLTEELIESLNVNGLTDMQISVDGVKPNNITIKTLKPLRKKLELLSKHARFKVVMSGVIGSAPPEEAVEVVRFARDHGFIPRILLIHDSKGQLRLNTEELEAYREVKRMIGPRLEDADRYREKLIRDGVAPFKCRAGSRYLYIDEFGIVHWCSQTREIFSKNLMDYTFDDLREQFYAPKFCNKTCTVGCVRTTSAFDEWRQMD